MRILITGGPKTGKTTLARQKARALGLLHLCTDPQKHCPLGVKGIPDDLAWSDQSKYIADNWLGLDNVIIEGVALPRALRKWKDAHPGKAPPCNTLIVLDQPHLPLVKGQAAMAKSVQTVLNEIYEWLYPVYEVKK